MNTDEHGLKTGDGETKKREDRRVSCPPVLPSSSLSYPGSSMSIRGSRSRFLIGITVSLTMAVVGLILFFFNPAQHAFYPQCFFHRWTGWQCPGCGGLRATHQLLHGNFAEAFRLNSLFIFLLPIGAWFGLREIVWQLRGKKLPAIFARPGWGWFLLGLAIIFTILRNL